MGSFVQDTQNSPGFKPLGECSQAVTAGVATSSLFAECVCVLCFVGTRHKVGLNRRGPIPILTHSQHTKGRPIGRAPDRFSSTGPSRFILPLNV